MADFQERVLMNKKTGKLSRLLKNTWLGDIIQYDVWPEDEPMAPDGPYIFDDNKRFKIKQYEDLGEL